MRPLRRSMQQRPARRSLKPKVEIEVSVQKGEQAEWTPYVRQTVRLLAACASSYVLATVIGLKEEYWAVITAVVVTQPQFDQTLKASKDRVLGTLIGAIAGFAVLEGSQYSLPALPLFWCALVPLTMLTAVWPNLRLACITLVVVVLIPANEAPFVRPLDRVFGILLGTAASLVVSLTFRIV